MTLKRNKADKWISQADYLQGELISEVKHEYIDGSVYAMSVEDIYFRVDNDDVKSFLKNTPSLWKMCKAVYRR